MTNSPWENRENSREGNYPDDYFRSMDKKARGHMYNFCFKSYLVSLAIAIAIGVAAVWVPASWYDVGVKLLLTNIILFVGATVGAFLCYIGIIGARPKQT